MSKIDTPTALALHAQGLTDGQIAEQFGCTRSGVTRWRQARDLPPNVPRCQKLDADDVRKARKMLREGMTRAQVGRAVGRSKDVIQAIRHAIGGDARLRRSGVTLQGARNAVQRDPAGLMAELRRVTRHVTDSALRDDVIGDMILDIMEGKLARQNVKAEARKYSGRAVSMWASPWGPKSIDEPLNEDGATLADLIACPSAAEWLASVGA